MGEEPEYAGADTVGHPIRHLVDEYARPHSRGFGIGLGAVLLARIPERVPALIVGVALDTLLIGGVVFGVPFVPDGWLPQTTTGVLWLLAGVLAVAVVAESLLDWVADHYYGKATLQTLHDVRVDVNEAVMGLSMGYFDDTQTGDVMSVLNNDVNNVDALAEGVYDGVETTASVIVAFAFMLFLHWQLALVVLFVPIVLGVTSRTYANLLEPRYDAVRASVGQVNSRLRDAVRGIATVKSNTRELREREAVEGASTRYKSTKWGAIKLRMGYDATTWVVSGLGSLILFLVGGYWILAGPPLFFTMELTAGVLVTFLMYSRSFLFPIRRLAVDVIDRYEDAHASAKRVLNVKYHPARIDDEPDAPDLEVPAGRVEYRDVTFSYDGTDEPALEDVDLTAESGDFIGIVGPTGAGKSTLVKLLFRFYDPDEGQISIDGQNTTSVSLRSLRQSIGYVSQEPFLFYGTVRENIAYGDVDASDEAVVRAAKRAGAHEFVTDLSEGYDAHVGEDGLKLSGGQRQRLAIARVLLRDPPILVLDEATSHVDNETELHIQQHLAAAGGETTTFAIAHRLSTVRNADRILVVEDGRIVESGTHGELLDRDGTYADLWRIQVGDVAAVSEAFDGSVYEPEVTES